MKFECGPTGAVDGIRVTEDSISLVGWAADLGFAVEGEVAPHAISTVEVFLNGVQIGTARSAGSRPDVAAYLGHHTNEVLNQCGWDFEANGLIPRGDDILAVVATCETGRSFVLDSTFVSDLIARAGP